MSGNERWRSTHHHLLVGRRREQAILRQHLEEAVAGHGCLVLVSGEAGIGKTTLVDWLAHEAEAARCLVLWGHAYDLSVTPPYGPWLELLEAYPQPEVLPPLPAFVGDLEAIAALGSQDRLFAAARDFFFAVAAQQPLVLVLEDLHWADQASLELLRVLARWTVTHRLLIVASYRSDELSRHDPLDSLIPFFVGEARAQRLNLRRLKAEAQRDWLSSCYELPEPDLIRLVAYLRTHAQGNPFFTQEVLRALEDDGALVDEDGTWKLGDLEQERVPPLIAQMIERRLGRLAGETRRMLQLAAVIGEEVSFNILQAMSDTSQDGLAEMLEQAIEARLLDESADRHHVRFIHALVRDALYEGLGPLRRQDWHRRVAEALIDSPRPDPDAVARHLREADDARAVEWLIRAGDRARKAYAWQGAVDRYTEALAFLTDNSGETRAWLLQRMAEVHMGEDPRRAQELFVEAGRLANVAGDGALSAYATFMHGLMSCLLSEYRAGLKEMRDALAALGRLPPAERSQLATSLLEATSRVPEPTAQLVMWLAGTGHFDEARALGEQVLAPDSTTSSLVDPNRLDAGAAFYGLAQVHATAGEPDRAREMYAGARSLFVAAGDRTHLHGILNQELVWVVIPYELDQPERRRRILAEIERTETTASGIRVFRGVPGSLIAPRLFLDGEWSTARRAALAARARVSGGAGRAVPLRTLGPLARAQGDTALAWELIREDLRAGPETEPGSTIYSTSVVLMRVAVELALDVHDLLAARAWLEAHNRWLDWAGAVLGRAEGHLLWARYHRADGDQCLAQHRAKQALAEASEPRQPLTLIAAHRLLGELDTTDRVFHDAEQHLAQSLALAEACAAPFERALTLLALAELRAAEGRTTEAQTALVEVRVICEPLEAKPTLARVAALEQRLDASATRPAHPAGLTTREVEVLRLVASGLSNREIAEALSISVRTVERHITNLYTKIDARGKADATAFAFRHHLT